MKKTYINNTCTDTDNISLSIQKIYNIDILFIQAFDPDLDDIITYFIQSGSYLASDTSLKDIVQNNPFELHPDSGELKLNFAVAAEMKGYIEFKIQAFDLGKSIFI